MRYMKEGFTVSNRIFMFFMYLMSKKIFPHNPVNLVNPV